jgi:hypothetical protein
VVRGHWAKFAVFVTVAVAIMSSFVAGAAAEGEAETGAFGSFRLKATNGYSMLVMAFSKPRFKHGEALVFVVGKSDAAIYFVSAKVTATEIEADLGPVGEIVVEFQPSGPPERTHASCKRGGSVTFEPGAWVGAIDFTGEEGFTEVHESRAKASVSPFIEAGCGGRSIGEMLGSQVRGARLVARSAKKKQSIYLQANQNRPGAPVYAEASIEERHAGLVVSREVADYYRPGVFEFALSLESATLTPSAPFAGYATFHRNAKPANRWTGNLTVDFPGRANVSLAGGRFKAALVHAKRTEERKLLGKGGESERTAEYLVRRAIRQAELKGPRLGRLPGRPRTRPRPAFGRLCRSPFHRPAD